MSWTNVIFRISPEVRRYRKLNTGNENSKILKRRFRGQKVVFSLNQCPHWSLRPRKYLNTDFQLIWGTFIFFENFRLWRHHLKKLKIFKVVRFFWKSVFKSILGRRIQRNQNFSKKMTFWTLKRRFKFFENRLFRSITSEPEVGFGPNLRWSTSMIKDYRWLKFQPKPSSGCWNKREGGTTPQAQRCMWKIEAQRGVKPWGVSLVLR